jgi:hypothetical protein
MGTRWPFWTGAGLVAIGFVVALGLRQPSDTAAV